VHELTKTLTELAGRPVADGYYWFVPSPECTEAEESQPVEVYRGNVFFCGTLFAYKVDQLSGTWYVLELSTSTPNT
jgi:hypothetical protein